MKIIKSSIKIKITLAFSLLVLPIIILIYFIFSGYLSFSSAINNNHRLEEIHMITSDIDRDVIDLQRNVVIYRVSSSNTSINNVNNLHKNIYKNIGKLTAIAKDESKKQIVKSITDHLSDYKEKFDIVVKYKQQQLAAIDNHVKTNIKLTLSPAEKYKFKYDLSQIEAEFYQSRIAGLSYLINNDYAYVVSFRENIKNIKVLSEKIFSQSRYESLFLKRIESYEKNFLKIFTLTRNYLYLINVVMAGSAQEILYMSEALSRSTRDVALKQDVIILDDFKKSRVWLVGIALFSISLVLFVPYYFSRLIARPIEDITEVFKLLAEEKRVGKISGVERVDEIGLLASAATVFKAKNEQTVELLQQANKSVEVQSLLNQQLVQEKQNVEKALSVRTDFLSNMSHELRTPLNSVIGFTVRLLKKTDSYDQKQLYALQAIERTGRHLLAVINDILDLSKLEANKLEIKPERINFGQLCQDLVDQVAPTAEEKQLELFYNNDDCVITLYSDPVRLSQILLNLLSNAIKYTEVGCVELNVRRCDNEELIEIAVKDTGVGIAKEDNKRLFSRFEQLEHNKGMRVGSGTGLGLSIVENLCRLMGITIEVKSEPNEGSCFTIIVPNSQECLQHRLDSNISPYYN